jgi:hypothetical protein
MLRRDPRRKAIVEHPMEIQRTQVSPEALIEYFDNRQRILSGVRSVFVWNMDEIGHADWPDTHSNIVYVPHDYLHATVPIGVNRMEKRIIIIGCICADGSYAKPMMIIPRHTVDTDLTLLGISDRNCHICYQANGFIDRELFKYWFGQIFVPEIEQRRKMTNYSCPTVLILDGRSAHDVFTELPNAW